MKKVTIDGYLAKDAELGKTKSGKDVTKIVVGTYDGKDTNGNNKTEWWNIEAYSFNALKLAKAKKGDYIIVYGELKKGAYKDQNGNERLFPHIIAETLSIEPKTANNNVSMAQDDVQFTDDEIESEELPF